MHMLPPPDRRQLRTFGLTTGAIVVALFGLLLPWLLSYAWPLWPWVVAGILGGLGLVAPMLLAPVYKGWMKFGHVMGAINTRIILGLFFYLIVTPMGLFMRLFRWDPMRRRTTAASTSHRVPSHVKPKQHMERPF